MVPTVDVAHYARANALPVEVLVTLMHHGFFNKVKRKNNFIVYSNLKILTLSFC